MQSKKQRIKQRRRAQKLSNQAWEAVDVGDHSLAVKLVRRATKTHAGNPRLWNDLGLILLLVEQTPEAVDAFQCALSLASDFADPYVHLATIAMQQGTPAEAVRLMRLAIELSLIHI